MNIHFSLLNIWKISGGQKNLPRYSLVRDSHNNRKVWYGAMQNVPCTFVSNWSLDSWFKSWVHVDAGENSQIPLFFEIISILPLFKKYVAIIFLKLEFDIELEFTKIEFLKVYRTWVPCNI